MSTNTLTFQHLHTSRTVQKDKKSCLTLYGRREDGSLCKVTTAAIDIYGYVYFPNCGNPKHVIESCYKYYNLYERFSRAMEKEDTESRKEVTPEQQAKKEASKVKTLNKNYSAKTFEMTLTPGYNIRHIHGEPKDVYKIQTKYTSVFYILKKILEYPFALFQKMKQLKAKDPTLPEVHNIVVFFNNYEWYETMLKPEAIWMIDQQLPSCSWITCQVNKEHVGTSFHTVTKSTMAPFKILSYDIEAEPGADGSFPQPERNPIITIGVVCFTAVDTEIQKYVFMYEPDGTPKNTSFDKLVDPPDDYDPSDIVIKSYNNEYNMLQGFVSFVVDVYDPDIITGYNIMNFDNVYLIKRIQHFCGTCRGHEQTKRSCFECTKAEVCETHKRLWCRQATCNKTRTLSRVSKPTTLRAVYKESNQKGGHESYDAFLEGREWMDLYDVIKNDHKLRSYKLDEVAKHFLGTKKIPIRYEDIPILQQTTEGRAKLAIYCVKDSYLVYKLAIKLCKITNAIQMSQVTGVALRDILHRGQQCRTISLMLQTVKKRDPPRWFLPEENGNNTDSFEGAVVITPKPGYYDRPVATLDFASLYPSIMRAYNMCYSTMITSPKLARQRGYNWSEAYEKPQWKNGDEPPDFRPVRHFQYEGYDFKYLNDEDNDICFLTTKQRQGILPEILESLLSERKRVKKMMKQVDEHSTEYQVYNGRQLALKVCANSVYGFTGAGKGYLSEKRISSSVTRVGRAMANYTKWKCETKYREHNVQVVYGDTDSVFVHLPKSICDGKNDEEILAESFRLGTEMAELCTNEFLLPNELEFEKVYYPLLLKGKKRYAGQKYEPGLKPKMDVKGFECVRRDFAPIVSKTQKECFIRLLTQKNMQSCVDYARQRVIDLLTGQVDLDELQLSKQLTRKPEAYKNPASHVKLAIRLIRELPEHLAPKTGDRIDYFIRTGFEKVCDRAVTRQDIETGKAIVDTDWYLENQLKQPLYRVFEMIMNNPQDIFKRSHIRRHVRKTSLFQNKTNYTDKVVAQPITIQPYKPSKTKKLFNAPQTRRKKRKTTKGKKAVVSKNIKDFFF